jgi:argininosuccinate lyase
VRDCLASGKTLEGLTLGELKAISTSLDAKAVDALKPEAVLAARTSRGGTGPSAVREQIKLAKECL